MLRFRRIVALHVPLEREEKVCRIDDLVHNAQGLAAAAPRRLRRFELPCPREERGALVHEQTEHKLTQRMRRPLQLHRRERLL